MDPYLQSMLILASGGALVLIIGAVMDRLKL